MTEKPERCRYDNCQSTNIQYRPSLGGASVASVAPGALPNATKGHPGWVCADCGKRAG